MNTTLHTPIVQANQGDSFVLDIILTRYPSRKSTVITSNRPLEDWGKLLRDNAASSAILDRVLHRAPPSSLKVEVTASRRRLSVWLKINKSPPDEKGKKYGSLISTSVNYFALSPKATTSHTLGIFKWPSGCLFLTFSRLPVQGRVEDVSKCCIRRAYFGSK